MSYRLQIIAERLAWLVWGIVLAPMAFVWLRTSARWLRKGAEILERFADAWRKSWN